MTSEKTSLHPIWLAIETAFSKTSVAVGFGSRVLASCSEDLGMRQAAELVPMIDSIMKLSKVEFSDLAGVIVTRGPGYFASLRLGLAAAHGIAIAANCKIATTTTLMCSFWAWQHQQSQSIDLTVSNASNGVLVLHDSKRREIYAQRIDRHGHLIEEPVFLPKEDLIKRWGHLPLNIIGTWHPLQSIGSGTNDLWPPSWIFAESTEPTASILLDMLNHAHTPHVTMHDTSRGIDDWPVPFYLNPPDISEPK